MRPRTHTRTSVPQQVGRLEDVDDDETGWCHAKRACVVATRLLGHVVQLETIEEPHDQWQNAYSRCPACKQFVNLVGGRKEER